MQSVIAGVINSRAYRAVWDSRRPARSAPHPIPVMIVVASSGDPRRAHSPRILKQGDAILFEADVPHSYRNVGDGEAISPSRDDRRAVDRLT